MARIIKTFYILYSVTGKISPRNKNEIQNAIIVLGLFN